MKIIGSVIEDLSFEKRVSITPESVKKFKNKDTNDIKAIPNKQFSIKSLPSLNFKNFELIINPIDIKINVHK